MLETLTLFFHSFIDIILNLDVKLQWVIETYDVWTYAILFIVVFCETGLIVTPFLPGDSLLFAAGAFAATGSLQIFWLLVIIAAAAILGNLLNYHIGLYIGPKVFKAENSKLFNKEYLNRAEAFYEKYGAKAIILSRFMPIIRTFAPFVAGIGKMNYGKFFLYNLIGAISWSVLFIGAGYFFGNLELVKNNFTAVIMLIIVISLIPAVKEFIQHHWGKRKEKTR